MNRYTLLTRPVRGLKYCFFALLASINLTLIGCGDSRSNWSESSRFTDNTPFIYEAVPQTASRASIANDIQYTQPLSDISLNKIYLHNNVIYAVQVGKGVQVIDNTNPAIPTPVGFITVPGILDMVIKDDFIFINHYADLVTLSVSDKTEVSRLTNQLAYTDYIVLPVNTEWQAYTVQIAADEIVVGYTPIDL